MVRVEAGAVRDEAEGVDVDRGPLALGEPAVEHDLGVDQIVGVILPLAALALLPLEVEDGDLALRGDNDGPTG